MVVIKSLFLFISDDFLFFFFIIFWLLLYFFKFLIYDDSLFLIKYLLLFINNLVDYSICLFNSNEKKLVVSTYFVLEFNKVSAGAVLPNHGSISTPAFGVGFGASVVLMSAELITIFQHFTNAFLIFIFLGFCIQFFDT